MTVKNKNTGKNSGLKNLKKWKKGESGNPKGRPKIPIELKEIKKHLKEHLEYVSALLTLDRSEFEKWARTKEASAYEYLIYRKMKQGNFKMVFDLFDRVLGKPAQEVELSGSVTNNNVDVNQALKRLPLEQRAKVVEAYLAKLSQNIKE